MRLRSLLRPAALLFGTGALSVTGILAMGHTSAPPPPDEGVVWVYFESMCATPGDATDCKEIVASARLSFDTIEACDAHRDKALAAANDPRLLGSCLRQHEA
jgi:hypothetical protein